MSPRRRPTRSSGRCRSGSTRIEDVVHHTLMWVRPANDGVLVRDTNVTGKGNLKDGGRGTLSRWVGRCKVPLG